MHVMIAVSSLGPDAKKLAAQQRAEQVLAQHNYASAFKGVYIVALQEESERIQLNDALSAAISADDQQALLLISPPISPTSGAYVGRLIPTVWPEVNKRIT